MHHPAASSKLHGIPAHRGQLSACIQEYSARNPHTPILPYLPHFLDTYHSAPRVLRSSPSGQISSQAMRAEFRNFAARARRLEFESAARRANIDRTGLGRGQQILQRRRASVGGWLGLDFVIDASTTRGHRGE